MVSQFVCVFFTLLPSEHSALNKFNDVLQQKPVKQGLASRESQRCYLDRLNAVHSPNSTSVTSSCDPFALVDNAFTAWLPGGISRELFEELVQKRRSGVVIRVIEDSVSIFALKRFVRREKPQNTMHALRALDLVSTLHSRVKLPDLEFFLHYEDLPAFAKENVSPRFRQPYPSFSLVSSPAHSDGKFGILFLK